ncbi:MAG: hypothetical protein ACFFD1_00190 [Candidatus Thorarchaeota archaeon]
MLIKENRFYKCRNGEIAFIIKKIEAKTWQAAVSYFGHVSGTLEEKKWHKDGKIYLDFIDIDKFKSYEHAYDLIAPIIISNTKINPIIESIEERCFYRRRDGGIAIVLNIQRIEFENDDFNEANLYPISGYVDGEKSLVYWSKKGFIDPLEKGKADYDLVQRL